MNQCDVNERVSAFDVRTGTVTDPVAIPLNIQAASSERK